MANICENTMHIYTEDKDNMDYFLACIKEMDEDDTKITHSDDMMLEVTFLSKWTFPEEEMDKLYKGIPNKDEFSITCLSVEWGQLYCQFATCNKDGWTYQG